MFDIIDKTEICAFVAPAGNFLVIFVTSLETEFTKIKWLSVKFFELADILKYFYSLSVLVTPFTAHSPVTFRKKAIKKTFTHLSLHWSELFSFLNSSTRALEVIASIFALRAEKNRKRHRIVRKLKIFSVASERLLSQHWIAWCWWTGDFRLNNWLEMNNNWVSE